MASTATIQSLAQTVPLLSWFKLVNNTLTEPYLVSPTSSASQVASSHDVNRMKSFTSTKPKPTAPTTSKSGTLKSPLLLAFISSPTSSPCSLDAV